MLAGVTLPGYTETTACYGVTMSATNSSITFCSAWHLSTTVAGALSPSASAKRHFTIGDHGCATLLVVARMSHSYIQNLICCTHSPIMASGLRHRCRRPYFGRCCQSCADRGLVGSSRLRARSHMGGDASHQPNVVHRRRWALWMLVRGEQRQRRGRQCGA